MSVDVKGASDGSAPTSVSEIQARLDKLTGPDREVDLLLERIGYRFPVLRWEPAFCDEDGTPWPDGIRYWTAERERSFATSVAHYTGSIDDAVEFLDNHHIGGHFTSANYEHKPYMDGKQWRAGIRAAGHIYGKHRTLPLAILDAGLKAWREK